MRGHVEQDELAKLIHEVSVLRLARTDALVVTPSRPIVEEEASSFAEALHRLFPENRIIITEHELKILRTDSPIEEEGEGVPGD
jgi:hypothetical protein